MYEAEEKLSKKITEPFLTVEIVFAQVTRLIFFIITISSTFSFLSLKKKKNAESVLTSQQSMKMKSIENEYTLFLKKS